jgi:SNF2 family DNA or RNA helicase
LTTFGRLVNEGGRFTIDALPHVMQRVRPLFKSARFSLMAGKFTHSAICLDPTPNNAKDVLWLLDRYPLEVEPETLSVVQTKASEYDRRAIAAAIANQQTAFDLSDVALQMAEPPRVHQVIFRNLGHATKRLLLGDEIGLGKTISAISVLCEPHCRPAIIVCPTHLMRQWERQIHRFLPGASTHMIKGRRPYPLPHVDVIITGYTRLQGWQDVLVSLGFKTAIFDEVQELRHTTTEKRRIARAISDAAEHCFGLSGTPIYNYGAEMWSVMDVISHGCLGTESSFRLEWCGGSEKVEDPAALRSYLVSQGLFLRRTRKDLGITSEPPTRDVIALEGDLETLRDFEDQAKLLALSVLRNEVGVSDVSARELDWKMRQITGVAKAKAVSEFVKMLIEQGEKVLLVGWHRQVYDIWLNALKAHKPVMYTGTETAPQKAEAVKKFIEGDSQVFIISLRAGAGLDGLQNVCHNVVFGELDWSPQVIDQVIGRLDREGQAEHVNAYFPTIDDGSDPFMLEVLASKRSQSDGLLGIDGEGKALEETEHSDRLRRMAESFLQKIGEPIPVNTPQEGLHAEVVSALANMALPSNTESQMQAAIYSTLPFEILDAKVQREVRIGERGRLDFLVSRGDEAVAVECKIGHTERAEVHRQVRRYAEHPDITSVVLLAPWSGVPSFSVDGTPVTVVDWTKQSLRRTS